MTDFDSYTLPATPRPARSRNLTIYRDTPLARTQQPRSAVLPLTSPRVPLPLDERSGGGMFLGLGILTVPTVVYSLVQLWHLCAGDALERAVRAIAS